ncbi:hypothetical protein LVY65_07210 [Sphingomonas sp. G124]|uniref:Uncharacterized protein n=1 Tax=Sphingomonas cremea TaxID=2904799 RepID=A0A9X1QLF3_9SPHN|nr:hypothetical protein [Sphingomonas cremea]MCF2514851.1 hypothetical protein [Sphingomonas cremea]
MEEYDRLMKQAARYRELANDCDGYQRRELIWAVQDLEAQAKRLKQALDDQSSKTDRAT